MARNTRKYIGGSNIKPYMPTIDEILTRKYIIPGSHETNSLDKVNRTSRFKICPSDGLAFHLGKKIGYLTDKCKGTDEAALRAPACTYGNFLQFTGPTLKDTQSYNGKTIYITCVEFWSNFFKFIKTMAKALQTVAPSDPNSDYYSLNKLSFFLGTHHNRLKKTIFEGILDNGENKKTIHFANCSCVKISISNDSVVSIECLHQGYPDKKDNIYLPIGKINETGDDNYGFLNSKIATFKKWMVNQENLGELKGVAIDIYIIRHGNAFHNAPLKIGNKNYFKRPLDSCLTPLGIYQAHDLANFLKNEGYLSDKHPMFFCSSYMNRAQLTISEIASMREYSPGTKNNFKEFKMLMRKMSMARLFRTLGKNSEKWNTALESLVNSFSAEKLPGTNKEKYNKLQLFSDNVENYYNSCERFMQLPTIRIPSEGTLLFQPPYSNNSMKIDFYTKLRKLSSFGALKGGVRSKSKKQRLKKLVKKYTKKRRCAYRKKRTKKKALKIKH